MKKIHWILIILIIIVIGFIIYNNNRNFETVATSNIEIEKMTQEEINQKIEEEIQKDPRKEFAFQNDRLLTNTAIRSIELDQILSGGPGKDGIPAINNPKFISVKDADKLEEDEHLGIAVKINDIARFYPYSILVWHEIVNDNVDGRPITVTFCPLCGSAIVFDPIVDGDDIRIFGVSGKLWESNLLMYDNRTESLWSQSIGEAVVGDETGIVLNVIQSQLLSFESFKEKYPDGQVLSRDTGHIRNYGFYPYGDYEESERIIFPVSVKDNRLPGKEIMYIVNFEDKSIAFKRSDLSKFKTASIEANGKNITATFSGGEISVTDPNGKVIPGYHEMWFSWATHHQNNGIVWTR